MKTLSQMIDEGKAAGDTANQKRQAMEAANQAAADASADYNGQVALVAKISGLINDALVGHGPNPEDREARDKDGNLWVGMPGATAPKFVPLPSTDDIQVDDSSVNPPLPSPPPPTPSPTPPPGP